MPKNSSRTIARKRFWSENDKSQYSCADCNRTEQEIQGTFEVHHKNGNPYDNRLENLVGVCSVCHAIREDRKPSDSALQNALRQLKTHDQTEHSDNLVYKIEYTVRRLMERHIPSDGIYNNNTGATISDGLGYESGAEMYSARPKTRREAAIFEAGRRSKHKSIFKELDNLFDQISSVGCCERCGVTSSDVDQFRDADLSIHIMPHATPERFHGNAVLCSNCSKEIMDGIGKSSFSYDRLENEIKKELGERERNGRSATDTIDQTTARFETQAKAVDRRLKQCGYEGCRCDSDYIYQLDDYPTSSHSPESMKDISILLSGFCSDHISVVEDEFESGCTLAPIDAFYKYIIRSQDEQPAQQTEKSNTQLQ